MKKLMNLIVLSCQKATLLIEKSHSTPLSFTDKIQLNMHLKICDKCAEYKKQSSIIEYLLKNKHSNLSNAASPTLSDSSKIRIQKAIEDNFKK